VIAANGETRWVDLLISTVGQRADLKQVEFSCTLIDMTDRVAAERALMHSANAEHSRELAEGASRAKTELLSRVSHELRTPLNAVLGFAQLLLREESAVRPDRRDFVKHIQTAGQDLLALVDEILEINRAESGHLPLHLSAVSLADAAKRVMVLQQPIAAVHHVQLEWAATPEWPISARADDGRVRQVLTNLIANAIKYNHAGGWVRLATGHDERSTWLEVRDSGRGMRSAQMAHLFEPFNRLGAERESSDGYGLGLSICKTFCDAMGGQLEVESVEDEGSCFRLRLPRWDRPPR
jgi:signal transduction histidine kinase